MVVEHSFDVWIVRLRHILFEFCLMEKKKERRKNKIEIFTFDLLDCEEKSWDSGAISVAPVGATM